MSGLAQGTGSANITANTAITPTTAPTWLFTVHLVSGATSSVLTLKNNGSSGTSYASIQGVANQGITVSFEGGLFFPKGLYATVDANISYATFSYIQSL